MSASPSPTDRRLAPSIAASVCLAAGLAAMFAGCGTPVPIIPEGAWSVAFVQPSALDCLVSNENTNIGNISADQVADLVENGGTTVGDQPVTVSCSVIDNGATFAVQASESGAGLILSINVNELSPTATKDKPSKGVVLYQSNHTANSYSQEDCNFYFTAKTKQSVSEGAVFVTFECDKISYGTDSICKITPGYAAFEKCAIAKEQN